MSNSNEANELAAQFVWGRTYRGNEPCAKPTKIVFHRGLEGSERVVIEDDGKLDWASVANRVQELLIQGYDYTMLPCERCGATELDDVLHCDGCEEPIQHGHEHPGVDEDGENATYCDDCYEFDYQGEVVDPEML